jgi:hypothetical protein
MGLPPWLNHKSTGKGKKAEFIVLIAKPGRLCQMQKNSKKPNYLDADERRFSGFHQAKNVFWHLSAQIYVPLSKEGVYNFLSNMELPFFRDCTWEKESLRPESVRAVREPPPPRH